MSPEYTCRVQCKPVYPDVLQYPENGEKHFTHVVASNFCLCCYTCTATTETPGAGTYEYDREFEDNDNPAYSIALPLPQKPSKQTFNSNQLAT